MAGAGEYYFHSYDHPYQADPWRVEQQALADNMLRFSRTLDNAAGAMRNTAGAMSTYNYTWYQWSNGTAGNWVYDPAVPSPDISVWISSTEELERRQHEFQEERARQVQREYEEGRERLLAEDRAEKLLMDSLDTAQRAMYQEAKKFLVTGGKTGTVYELNNGQSPNIRVLDQSGQVSHRLCVHLSEYMPMADNLVAQKVWLESAAEEELLRIANRHNP